MEGTMGGKGKDSMIGGEKDTRPHPHHAFFEEKYFVGLVRRL